MFGRTLGIGWLAAVLVCLVPADAPASGSIFSWTDENGVRNFSNQPPPASAAGSVETASEIPYDPEADKDREHHEREWRRERELEAVEDALRRTQERLDAAEAAAEEAATRVDALENELDAALDAEDRYRVVYPYYWRPPHHRPHPKPPHYRPGPVRPRPLPQPFPENPRRKPRPLPRPPQD